MKIIFNVSCNDEYFNEYPQSALVTFTKESIERLLSLMDKVKELNVFRICDWDSPDLWFENNLSENSKDLKEWDGVSECEMVYIYSDSISWYAYIKNSGIKFGTYDSMYRDMLNRILKFVDEDITFHIGNYNEVIKVCETSKKELPILMGSLKSEDAKTIFSKRLKKNS